MRPNAPAVTAAPAGPVSAGEVTVVLPTFDEAGNIVSLMERLLDATGPGLEIIVVDDDSPDGTAALVRQFAAGHPGVRLILRKDERGLTSAIRRGIAESRRPVVCWMDCDLSMPPEDLPRLLAALAGRHFAIGTRYRFGGADRGHGPLASALSRLICLAAGLALGSGVRDMTSGFLAARREAVVALGLNGDYGEYCIDLLCRAAWAGYGIVEVPYVCVPRVSGQSKTGASLADYLRRGRKYLAAVARLGLERLRRALRPA